MQAMRTWHVGLVQVVFVCRCGSGLSGEALSDAGHTWVGVDLSLSMLGGCDHQSQHTVWVGVVQHARRVSTHPLWPIALLSAGTHMNTGARVECERIVVSVGMRCLLSVRM